MADSGTFGRPHRPALPGLQEFTGQVLHAADYRSPTPFSGRRMVVGAGNSAGGPGFGLCRPRGLCLAALDPDWDCPWQLDWQRHYHHLAQLAEDEPSGHLPHIAPGVLMDGDDFGRWFQRQRRDWRLLSSKQQKQLSKLGVQPAQARPPTPTVKGAAKGPSKAQQAFQRGLAALAQWIEREGAHRPVPRGHGEQITVDGEAEPALVKLGVWVSSTRCRRDKLTSEQLQALRGLGVEWA